MALVCHKKARLLGAAEGEREGSVAVPEVCEKGESANVAQEDDKEVFAFTCTSDHADIADKLNIPPSKRGGVTDSGELAATCYDRSKFISFTPIPDLPITTADGSYLQGHRTGDVRIDLPNGAGRTLLCLEGCSIRAADGIYPYLNWVSYENLDLASISLATSVKSATRMAVLLEQYLTLQDCRPASCSNSRRTDN